MILALDVGNTNIVVGVIDNGEIVGTVRLATDTRKTSYEYGAEIGNILGYLGHKPVDFEGCVISSVVGPVTASLKEAVKFLLNVDAFVVGKNLKTGLEVNIDDPNQIGADLVVGSVAAKAYYSLPCIMIDLGTATTVFALDAQGRFVGGAIAPGLRTSMEALANGTSALPQVALEAPDQCIGTNTVECMQSGAIYGTAAMLDGLVSRMEEELGQKALVVATGGLASCVVNACHRDIIVDDYLLLKGIWILWEMNKG